MTRLAPVIDLSTKSEAKILFLTDLHYPDNNRTYIQRQFTKKRKISKTKEAPYYDLILLGGDITEGQTLDAPGASVTGASEADALRQFDEDIQLIPRGVQVEIVEGNHDTRSKRSTGQDVTWLEFVAKYRGLGI